MYNNESKAKDEDSDQPIEDDAFSKQAFIDELHKHFSDGFDSDKYWNSTHVLSALNALPPIKPRQKQGTWIYDVDITPASPMGPEEINYAGWVCSRCRKFPTDDSDWDNPDNPPVFSFCPNCGIQMRKGG